MRTISVEEYQALTEFCIKHGVKYYDLQVELNDHLANAIEQIWTKNPAITFDEALEQVHKGFGKTGFRSFVKSKEIACQKVANKLFWNAFQSFFKWPHAVLVLLMILLYVIIYLQMMPKEWSLLIGISSFVIVLLDVILIISSTKQRKQEQQPLLSTRILSFNFLTAIIPSTLIGTQSDSLWDGHFKQITTLPQFIFIAALQIFSIVVILASYYSNQRIIQEAQTNYPKAYT